MYSRERLQEFVKNPKELRFQEVRLLLGAYGYHLKNSKGSHFRFKRTGSPPLTIVAHNNKVKKWYVKDACKTILALPP